MNRGHYTFAIILTALGVVASLFQGHLYLRLDNQFFIQKSFINWFLVTNMVGFAGTFFLLKYFHFKKYGFAFKTGMVATVCNRLPGNCALHYSSSRKATGVLPSYCIPDHYCRHGVSSRA